MHAVAANLVLVVNRLPNETLCRGARPRADQRYDRIE
jgi:hypothetical protein